MNDDDFVYTADIDDDDDDYALYEFDDGMDEYGDEKEMDFLQMNESNKNNNNNNNNKNSKHSNNNNNNNNRLNNKNNPNNKKSSYDNKSSRLQQNSKKRPSYHNPLHFNNKIFKRSGYRVDECLSSAVKCNKANVGKCW